MITDTEYIVYEPTEGIKKFDASTNKVITLVEADEMVRNLQLIVKENLDYINSK